MSRLVAFGYSNTLGEGLPDYNDDYGPSKHAWPQLLGDKLGLSVVNLGKGGESNKFICSQVLDTDFKRNDLVVFMWTFFSRTCFFTEQGLPRRILPSQMDWWQWITRHKTTNEERSNLPKKRMKEIRDEYKLCMDYYEKYFSYFNSNYESYQQINFAKMYLDSKGIKNYHTTCERLPFREDFKYINSIAKLPPKKTKVEIPNWNTVNLHSQTLYDKNAADGSHPSVKAHKKIAQDIFNFISGIQ